MPQFLTGAASDPGRQRSNNEDSFLVTVMEALPQAAAERGLLVAVADGVGGRQAGEVASQTAVRSLYEAYYSLPYRGPTSTLAAAVAAANQAVWSAAQQSQQRGMATTLAAAVVQENLVTVAHVGDSRAYLIGPTAIQPLTSDHTVVNELLHSGALTEAEAANHPQRHILSRSLGGEEEVEVSGVEVAFAVDDALLLCSDGLSNLVAEAKMAEVVRALPPQAAAERLVALANAAGGADNITVVIVRRAMNGSAAAPALLPMAAPGSGGGWRSRWPILSVVLLGLVVLLVGGWIGRTLMTPTPTPTPTRTRTPAVTATPRPTLAAIAPTPSLLATRPAPTSTLAPTGAVPPAGGRRATLKDPWGRGQWSYLYSGKNDNTGIVWVPLDGSVEITVYSPEDGDPTGYKASGANVESSMWYQAEYEGQTGWVACPLVWFTDEQTWATCQ